MTKQEWEATAHILREQWLFEDDELWPEAREAVEAIVGRFSRYYKVRNLRFDEQKFKDAIYKD